MPTTIKRIPVTSAAFPLRVTFTVLDCSACGVVYAVTDEYEERRRFDGARFYCPNGHGQAFTETEADRLRQQLAEECERSAARLAHIDQLAAEKYELRAEVREQKRAQTRLLRRVTNGVCPCCQRTFADVARHMKTRHPSEIVGPKA